MFDPDFCGVCDRSAHQPDYDGIIYDRNPWHPKSYCDLCPHRFRRPFFPAEIYSFAG